jgi:hypothetical protein
MPPSRYLGRRSATTTPTSKIDKLAQTTPEQRRAFDLIDSPIPLTIAA